MKFYVVLLSVLMILFSCRKGPGLGGNATITGRVYEYDYNSDFTALKGAYFKGNQEVFIVYGNENVYADKFETHHDGTFEFSYLLPGEYTIYTYSRDKTGMSLVPVVVEKKVQITSQWEQINVDTLIIYK